MTPGTDVAPRRGRPPKNSIPLKSNTPRRLRRLELAPDLKRGIEGYARLKDISFHEVIELAVREFLAPRIDAKLWS